ncbi:MAG: hypothetical protein AAGB10_06835 [Pseudomonadota bacterium]
MILVFDLLRLGRVEEDRVVVLLHPLKPPFDTGGTLVKLGLHPDLRTKHVVANLLHQFIEGIALAVIEPAQIHVTTATQNDLEAFAYRLIKQVKLFDLLYGYITYGGY